MNTLPTSDAQDIGGLTFWIAFGRYAGFFATLHLLNRNEPTLFRLTLGWIGITIARYDVERVIGNYAELLTGEHYD